ncbi:MAG: DUF2809 domain-containing protein [Chitinophagales bacterium]
MKQRLPYITATVISFIVCVIIFNVRVHFIRYVVGDFFVVIFMYTLIKSVFPKLSPILLTTAILVYSIAIEVLQFFHLPQYFGTEKLWVKVLLGSSFSFGDILAYFLGIVSVYWLDRELLQKLN